MSITEFIQLLRDAHAAGALLYHWVNRRGPDVTYRVAIGERGRDLYSRHVHGYVLGACDRAGIPVEGMLAFRKLDEPPVREAAGPARRAATPSPGHALRVEALWDAEAAGLVTFERSSMPPDPVYVVTVRGRRRCLLAGEVEGYLWALRDGAVPP